MPLGDRSGSNKLQQVVELFLGRFAGFSHGKRSERGCHVPIGNLAKDEWNLDLCDIMDENFERLTVDEPCICCMCVCSIVTKNTY